VSIGALEEAIFRGVLVRALGALLPLPWAAAAVAAHAVFNGSMWSASDRRVLALLD
jgi:hypothetical protein